MSDTKWGKATLTCTFKGSFGARNPVCKLVGMQCHLASALMAWVHFIALCANPSACAHACALMSTSTVQEAWNGSKS